MLDHDDDPAAIRLQLPDGSIDGVLPSTGGSRRLFVVTLGNADTALILDGTGGRPAEVTVGIGGSVRVRPVAVAR